MMGTHDPSEWKDRMKSRRNPLQPGEVAKVENLDPQATSFITVPLKGPLLHLEILIKRPGILRVHASENERFPNADSHEFYF